MTAVDPPTEVTVGLRFFHLVADEKCLWEVREEIGKGYWECEVVDSWDYNGRTDAFWHGTIVGSLRVDAIFGGYDPANYEPGKLDRS